MEPTTGGALAAPSDLSELDAATRQWRSELLAIADATALVALADRCLENADAQLVGEPVVGTVPLSVREPVVGERFILAEVLATRAEVDHRGVRGWALRLGDDRAATLAAAICDAEAAAGGPVSLEIEALCIETESRAREQDAKEWAELAPTEVHFEELST